MAIKFLNTVAVDTDVLYVDATNNRVGIGTASPSKKLEVAGDAKITGSVTANSFVGNLLGNVNGNVTGNVTGNLVNGSLSNITSLSVTGTGDSYFAGNVGIGTTSPSQKLDVVGRTKITQSGDALRINSSDANGSYATWQNNGSNIGYVGSGYHLWASPNNIAANLGIRAQTRLDLGVQTSVHMTILNSGNVGIGTTSPSVALDVSGEIAIRGGEAADDARMYFRASDNSNRFTIETDLGGTTGNDLLGFRSASADNILVLKGDGNVGIGTTSPGSKLDINGVTTSLGFRTAAANTNWSLISRDSAGNSPLYVQSANTSANQTIAKFNYGSTTANGGSNVLTVAKDNSYFLNTDVGIGTASPSAGLQVALGGTAIPTAGSSTASAVFGNSTSDNNYGLAIGANSNGVGYISSQRTDGAATTYNLAIQPNGGNVGIGTTSPTANLHIEGGTNNEVLKIEADVSPFIRWVKSGSDVGFLQFTSTSAYLSNMSNGSFFFRTNNTDKMTITSTGNVGIGTTNPSAKLDITDNNPRIRLTSSSTGLSGEDTVGAIDFYTSDASSQGQSVNAKIEGYADDIYGKMGLRFYTGWKENVTEKMRIKSNGNVGIGTTTPGSKLEVNGSIDANGGDGYLINGYGWAIESSGVLTLGDWDGSDFQTRIMDENSTEVFRVTDGKVGIGTTSPSAKLQVAGGVQIADDTDAASVNKVGTLKYRVSGNNSYVDMCMQTGATSYAWINIIQNNW